jgi:hypothetical protein
MLVERIDISFVAGQVITIRVPDCPPSKKLRKGFFALSITKPFRVMANGSPAAPCVVFFVAPQWSVQPVGALVFAQFLKVTCDERCQMPTLWRGKFAQCCVLRNLRNANADSTTAPSRGRFIVVRVAAATCCEPASAAPQPLFASARSSSSTPGRLYATATTGRRLSAAVSRRQGDG